MSDKEFLDDITDRTKGGSSSFGSVFADLFGTHTAAQEPIRGHHPWRPQKASRIIIDQVAEILTANAEFLGTFQNAARTFRFDIMQDQPADVLLWCEGQGLHPLIRRWCDPYGARVITSGGFDGLTLKHQFAERYQDRSAIVLHCGDYDPSGEVMFRALSEDVEAFGGRVDFHRIAVTRDQIDLWGLPTKPAKTEGNTHANAFDDDVTVELEALPPRTLQGVITDALESHMDMGALAATEARSVEARIRLSGRVSR